jgi:MurNAc alpha-1-phosphate uridylyltransferase
LPNWKTGKLENQTMTPTPFASTTIPAMLLAAGRGERMRPLTDHTPKPLLPVCGKPLMQWAMEALARGGFTDVVVNTAWLGEQIVNKFDSIPMNNKKSSLLNSELPLVTTTLHPALGLTLRYSHEGRDFGGALETAGGIARALPLLGTHFWVLAGDVFAPDFQFTQAAVQHFIASGKLAHLWLVPNPAHNLKGDFGLSAEGLALNDVTDDAVEKFTYSTIGLYQSALFAPPYCGIPSGNPGGHKAALAPLLRAAIAQGQVSAEVYVGAWTDVGTPERLAALG